MWGSPFKIEHNGAINLGLDTSLLKRGLSRCKLNVGKNEWSFAVSNLVDSSISCSQISLSMTTFSVKNPR